MVGWFAENCHGRGRVMLDCLAGWSGGLSVRAGGDCVRNGIIFGAAMAEKKIENGKVRCSAAYPTGRERIFFVAKICRQ